MTDPGWLAREIAELERRMARWPDWKRRESGTNCNTVILTVSKDGKHHYR